MHLMATVPLTMAGSLEPLAIRFVSDIYSGKEHCTRLSEIEPLPEFGVRTENPNPRVNRWCALIKFCAANTSKFPYSLSPE